MVEPNCCVILFNSTHQALRGEKVLKRTGIRHYVINTPREFSVDCGISLRVETGRKEQAMKALDEAGVDYAGVQPYYSRWM